MQGGRLEVKQKKKKRGEKEKGKRETEKEKEKEKGDGKGKRKKKRKRREFSEYLSSRPEVHVCIYTSRTMVRLVVVVVVIHEPTTFLPSPSPSLSLYPRSIFHIHSSVKEKKRLSSLGLVGWGLV